MACITVSAGKYRTMPGPKHPTDLIGLAHSPAYFIAAAVADKGYGWVHTAPVKVADPVIGQLIDKIASGPGASLEVVHEFEAVETASKLTHLLS